MTERLLINVTGIVQAIPFRPFIFNLAESLRQAVIAARRTVDEAYR